jgi:hypothetical protein
VEIVRSLEADQVPTILLKGPVIARWLYGSAGQTRGYGDIDLLVPSEKLDDAVGTLRRLGFDYAFASAVEREATSHALVLTSRPERSPPPVHALDIRGVAVDLHWTLHGVKSAPEVVWDELEATAETIEILDTPIRIPGEAARALHVALHAGASRSSRRSLPRNDAQAAYFRRPLDDLEHALDLVKEPVWRAAGELAARLDAVPLFTSGLSMDRRGEELAERLGILDAGDVDARLRAAAAPPLSFGIRRLRSTRGLRARARLLVRELFPTPSFMRVWSPIARRGRLGLMLAYVYRPFWLAVKLPGAVVAVARASRDTEDPRRH